MEDPHPLLDHTRPYTPPLIPPAIVQEKLKEEVPGVSELVSPRMVPFGHWAQSVTG